MRKWGLLFASFGLVWVSFGQQAEPLLFKEKIFDFGEIAEESGNADHEFRFTNNSGRPVKIISVQASCGCTTPGWTQEVIANGKEGFVKASYNPKSRPGYFNKTLTVTTDLVEGPVVLQIKGQVVTQNGKISNDELTAYNGNLKLKSPSFNVGKIFLNRAPQTKEYVVLNAGSHPIKFISSVGPTYIKVETPVSLNANQSGSIKLTYDAAARKQFGFVSD